MKKFGLLALVVISQLTWSYELPTKAVDLQMRSAGVRDILENLLVDSGFGYDIDPRISNDAKINVTARGQWAKVFRRLLDDQGLTFGFDKAGKILVIKN